MKSHSDSARMRMWMFWAVRAGKRGNFWDVANYLKMSRKYATVEYRERLDKLVIAFFSIAQREGQFQYAKTEIE